MSTFAWREPTAAERDLAHRWIARWNAATGDSVALPDAWQAATSCDCGACPSFAVSPAALSALERKQRPLSVEGEAVSANGERAGLIAFWSDNVLDLEIFPYEDRPLTDLAALTVTLGLSRD